MNPKPQTPMPNVGGCQRPASVGAEGVAEAGSTFIVWGLDIEALIIRV